MQPRRFSPYIPPVTAMFTLVAVIFLISPSLASDHAVRCAAEDEALKAIDVADALKPPPPFEISRADGTKLTMADFAGRGVIVNFWATWCVPCVREMPELDALKKDLMQDDVDVLAVSMDRGGAEAVRAFYEKYGIRNLDVLVDPKSAAARTLGIRGLPTTLLIDARGREAARIEGIHKYDTAESIDFFRRCIAPEGS